MIHLTTDLKDNHDRFIKRVKQSGVVWGLKCDEGWAICPSDDTDRDVFPFWSDEAYAKRHCIKEWSHYKPAPIELKEFIDSWLNGLQKAGELVGTNWNADLAGLEIEPGELAKQLKDNL